MPSFLPYIVDNMIWSFIRGTFLLLSLLDCWWRKIYIHIYTYIHIYIYKKGSLLYLLCSSHTKTLFKREQGLNTQSAKIRITKALLNIYIHIYTYIHIYLFLHPFFFWYFTIIERVSYNMQPQSESPTSVTLVFLFQ